MCGCLISVNIDIPMQCIAFDQVVSGGTVRCTNINDTLYLSARDIIGHVCSKDLKHACCIWQRIESQFDFEHALEKYQFKGRGQSKQPVITVEGAMKLVMILPGNHAKRVRSAAATILSRYILGDPSLIEEVRINKIVGPIAACEMLSTRIVTTQNAMPVAGWVYGTQSDAFLGLIKIGCSTNMESWMHSANTFCSPAPHVIVAAVPTFNHRRDEKMAHIHFAKVREQGEFFRVSKEDVQNYFNFYIMPVYQAELLVLIDKLQQSNS